MTDDLLRADSWAHIVDVRGCSDKQLEERFAGFSMEAKEMLLKDWENASDKRMKEVVEILKGSMDRL